MYMYMYSELIITKMVLVTSIIINIQYNIPANIILTLLTSTYPLCVKYPYYTCTI